MERDWIQEKSVKSKPGIPMLLLGLLMSFGGMGVMIGGIIWSENGGQVILRTLLIVVGALIFIASFFVFAGLKIVRPNEALVMTLFGAYYGTIKTPGFYLVHPFAGAVNDKNEIPEIVKNNKGEDELQTIKPRNRISMKVRSLNNEMQKVNDILGNPVDIGTIVIWHVADPTLAVFNVDNYEDYLSTQCDSIVRNIARLYPYDNLEDDGIDDSEQTLMGSSQFIADQMLSELQERVNLAGLEIQDVRISHLSYSEEIAAAMLQRQQASAIVAARSKIVEGAVGMVEMALDALDKKDVVVLDDERRAQMVSNLLVVLCGNRDVQPIVNSGSIY